MAIYYASVKCYLEFIYNLYLELVTCCSVHLERERRNNKILVVFLTPAEEGYPSNFCTFVTYVPTCGESYIMYMTIPHCVKKLVSHWT